MPVDVCILCSCMEIPLSEHFGCAVFALGQLAFFFFASVLYICLYKYVQHIIVPSASIQ